MQDEEINTNQRENITNAYIYDERNDIAKTLNEQPKFLERKKIIPRVLDKIIGFVDKFYER